MCRVLSTPEVRAAAGVTSLPVPLGHVLVSGSGRCLGKQPARPGLSGLFRKRSTPPGLTALGHMQPTAPLAGRLLPPWEARALLPRGPRSPASLTPSA